MATYRFTAEDHDGRKSVDRIEARTAEEARQRLAERGLRVLEIEEVEAMVSPKPPPQALSSDEAGQLAEHVAQLGAGSLPLAGGLRAAAEESDSPRLATAMCWLADQVEQGRSLEDALLSASGNFPRYVSGLVAASVRTGQLGPALSELVEQQRAARGLRRGILSGLAYPLLVVCLATAVFLFIIVYVGGSIEKISLEFGARLPMSAELFFWWRRTGIWVLAGAFVLLVLVVLLLRWCLDRARWHRLLASVPIVGPIWHWLGLVEWASLLEVLIRYQLPLLEALRLSAEGVANANVTGISLSLAEGVARGRSLSQAMENVRQVPASLLPVVRWGEQTGQLAESLGAGREMLEQRVRMRSFWLQQVLPPVLFIGIGCVALFVLAAVLMPLISLISHLSG